MRADPADYGRLPLRAHTLLEDVPLHDVWSVELRGGGPGRTLQELRSIVSMRQLASASRAVGFFFWLRRQLGRLFRWDRGTSDPTESTYFQRLTTADRQASVIEPGTSEGPGRTLYASPSESIEEIRNATVHAFSVFALVERNQGYRLYWAIYVLPVGWITRWYMRLINPFRRYLIYPAVLRHIGAAWERELVE